MSEFGQSLFSSLLVELVVVIFAILFRNDKRKVAIALAIGTLIAGIIGFGPNIWQNLQTFKCVNLPTFQSPKKSNEINVNSIHANILMTTKDIQTLRRTGYDDLI